MSKVRVNSVETLDGKGEAVFSFEYEAGLVLESHGTIVRDGDLEYKLSKDTALPYTTTGAGMPEDGAFVSIGDSELRGDLADPAQGGELVKVTTSTGNQVLSTALNSRVVWRGSLNGLKNIRTSELVGGQQVALTELGREGLFRWVTGDQSANVAEDPQQGIWVAPNSEPTGESGAWKRLDKVLTPEMFGAVGNGVADDTDALVAFFSKVSFGRGEEGAVYSFTSPFDITVPDSVYEFNRSSFVYNGADPGATPCIRFFGASGCSFDRLNLNVPAGVVVRRGVSIPESDVTIKSLEVTSTDQQNNRSANIDAAVSIIGNRIDIGNIKIDNFDNGVRWGFADCKVKNTEISSYVRGVWMDTPTGAEFGRIRCHTTSPNASGSPGHNGVLATGVTDLSGEEINVTDSGEHGVRISGSSNTNRINIERIICRNTGNSGVKFRCNDAFTINDVNIGSIYCEDCGDPANPITNQEGLMLERVRRVWIGHYALRRRNKTYSCHNGVSVFDAQIVHIGSVKIEDTNREAFFLQSEGVDDTASTIFKDINDFTVGGGVVHRPGRHLIFMDLNTAVVRNINFSGPLHCRALTGAALVIFTANSGIVFADSYFNLDWQRSPSPTGDVIRGAGINSNVLLEVRGNDAPTSAATSKAGSTWWNKSSGVRNIRNTSGDWVNIVNGAW